MPEQGRLKVTSTSILVDKYRTGSSFSERGFGRLMQHNTNPSGSSMIDPTDDSWKTVFQSVMCVHAVCYPEDGGGLIPRALNRKQNHLCVVCLSILVRFGLVRYDEEQVHHPTGHCMTLLQLVQKR